MKKILRKLIPEKIILAYHYMQSLAAAIIYGFPAKNMIIVGVTGTKGKTSAINYVWSVLNSNGIKTGVISTANVKIGDKEELNKYHMTMPGRFLIQKLLKKMKNENCKYCLVETTSEGLKQFRHIGVYYDIAVFTNLTPEHLPSHEGSFEKYKEAKDLMFKYLEKSSSKYINDQAINKIIIANNDSEFADFYLNHNVDKKITFSMKNKSDFRARLIKESEKGINFIVNNVEYKSHIMGSFNIYNALPAIIIGKEAGLDNEQIKEGISNLSVIPGRMEEINLNQDFKVLVDYAHEEQSITNVLKTANKVKDINGKVIILLGAEGGGRDTKKRSIMGKLSAELADYVIISDVDPYEDDRIKIIEDIAVIAEQNGKIRDKNLFTIADRKEGIKKALQLATNGDIVLITGKGAEQSITINGKKSFWDDRTVTKEELHKLLKS
ncbi:UDP-N-acetylmuramyl-tripeptide synthetase [bacterium]|nr:UDP-N-acetylmuramyl-tripeptide synthetase [bacterium]